MAGRTFENYRDLYPATPVNDSGYLEVSDLHALYYEESGNREGLPALFVPSWPGLGSCPEDRGFFDPEAYRIVLYDPRGSGRSIPGGEIQENTMWDAVEDIEKLRKELGIDKWSVMLGGGWGSTLTLAYTQAHTDKVRALAISGVCLARSVEMDWLYGGRGLSMMAPDEWEAFADFLPLEEHENVLEAYYTRLTSDNPEVVKEAAKHWTKYQMATSYLLLNQEMTRRAEDDEDFSFKFARLGCHYAKHQCFMKRDTQLLDEVDKVRPILTTIVQGRYDINCPPGTAWELLKRWPEAHLMFAQADGHDVYEPGIRTHLLDATDKFKKTFSK